MMTLLTLMSDVTSHVMTFAELKFRKVALTSVRRCPDDVRRDITAQIPII